MIPFPKHPFSVEAHFDSSLVLAFAFPKEELMHFIPELLELDLFDDKYAFIAVAMVQTSGLRPKGFPLFMGRDFFLMGYRVFVRYRTSEGRKLRGLYILKSQTDRRLMKWAGNLLTNYRYEYTPIEVSDQDAYCIKSPTGFDVKVRLDNDAAGLPEGSPFNDWKEARRFAGPMPFTFTANIERKEMMMIEGVRKNWRPKPVEVSEYTIPFLEEMGLEDGILANAFVINDVPYYWKKGVVDQWGEK